MIQVRAALSGDADAIAAIYAPHVLSGIASFEEDAPDAAEMTRRIAAGGELYPWLVTTRDAEVIAYAYASPFHTRPAYRWTVETTIYVADAAQGQGVGRHLYLALLDTLTEQGFAQAVARIALPNDPSVALHETAGFRRTGVQHAVGYKRGQWIDVGLWQRALTVSGGASLTPHA